MKPGRPPGAKQVKPLSDWQKIGTVISPEAKAFLNYKKREGYVISLLVNRAIMDLKSRTTGE